jgi:hypothetical protein
VAPALHSFIIRERKDAAHILENLFDSHVDLRKLILESCNLGDNATGILNKIVALYPELEALSLEGCYPLYSNDYSVIPRLKKLSELKLLHNGVYYVKLNCYRTMFVYVNTCSRTQL